MFICVHCQFEVERFENFSDRVTQRASRIVFFFFWHSKCFLLNFRKLVFSFVEPNAVNNLLRKRNKNSRRKNESKLENFFWHWTVENIFGEEAICEPREMRLELGTPRLEGIDPDTPSSADNFAPAMFALLSLSLSLARSSWISRTLSNRGGCRYERTKEKRRKEREGERQRDEG